MCFCCRVLRSFTPAIRFYCRVLRSSTPAIRFYLECPAFIHACHTVLLSRPALVHACHTVLFGMSCVRLCATVAASCAGSRLSFFLCQEKKRLAVCSVSVPRSFARRVLRPAVRFCWNVLRSALRHCCSVLRSSTPVFFPLSGKKKRLAVCFVPVPRGRNRHLQVLMPFNGDRALLVHFGTARFFMAIPTGVRGTRGTEGRGSTELAARREDTFA